MYYHIQLVGNHYIKITDTHVEIISIATNGRYDYFCFNNEVILHIFKSCTEKTEISQEFYQLQATAWAEYRKANKPEILGDAIPELNGMCPSDCVCFECIKTVQVIG